MRSTWKRRSAAASRATHDCDPAGLPSGPEAEALGLTARDVRISYGSVQVLHEVDLTVEPGSVTALVGVNGAGKTTLLKGLMGLLPKTGGTISLRDGAHEVRIDGLRAHQVARHGVTLVPEGRGMLASMSVAENLDTAGFLIKGREERRSRAERIMTRFPRLRERRDQLAGTLSGGEQQMVAIGRALMSSPRLLLLDEPSLGLAPVIVQEIVNMIKDIRSVDTSILLVEQNTKIALDLADQVYVLENGRVVFDGSPKELASTGELAALYLGGTISPSPKIASEG